MKNTEPLEYKFEKLLESVSRTFALSINKLPSKVKEPITLSYLLLRVSDILEDNDVHDASLKSKLLKKWIEAIQTMGDCTDLIQALQDLDHSDPEVIVALRAQELIDYLKTFPEDIQLILKKYVCDTTQGMIKWQQVGPKIQTVEEMDDYMHHVAGIVGYLITEIFAAYSPKIKKDLEVLMPLSRQFGLALQTVNIIQGMRKDYQRGWVFVPKVFFDRVGISEQDFFKITDEDKVIQVIDLLVEKAELHLRQGLDYVTGIPKTNMKIRLACMWPLFFAVKTLTVSYKNIDLLKKEVKISREEVLDVISKTMLHGVSNRWTKSYYYKLLEKGNLTVVRSNRTTV